MSAIIVVTGYLASGKSTFTHRLSKALRIPYLVKDTFKIALCESASIISRDESSRYSVVTFDGMMYVAERLIETGHPIIIEGNFVPVGMKMKDEAGTIKKLIDKYDCRSLVYKFVGDTWVLHKRYLERDKLPERGQVNAMLGDIPYGDFDKLCRNLDAFDIGGVTVNIDTTDFEKVDFDHHIEMARKFVGGN